MAAINRRSPHRHQHASTCHWSVVKWCRGLVTGSELELLGSGCNTDVMKDQVDALWTQTRQALNSLVSFVPSSVAHGSLDGTGEE
jgi:hypothetical protein